MQKLLFILLLSLFIVNVPAQTPSPTPAAAPSGIKGNLAAGEVSSVNQTANKLSIQTADGAIEVLVGATTVFKRVPPENPVITAAVASSFSEIGEKDKILVTGAVSTDKKTITAKNVYLMSKSDISKKIAAEREAWKTRGITGRVVKVDFKTKNVTISSRSLMGESEVTLTPKENAEFLRYAPDSAKFADAVASNLAEIKVGDQLRALGDKSADGLTFKAEKFLTGSFKTVAGKITAIDVAKNEITIEETSTKKPAVIVVNGSSVLKQFPAEMAQNMARMMSGGFGGMQPPQGGQGGGTFIMRPAGQGAQEVKTTTPQTGKPGNQTTPAGSTTTPTGGSPDGGGQRPMGGGGGGRRGADLDDILERLPAISIAQLKVGDVIGVSSTAATVPNRFIAFKLVSGVEPFLSIPQTSAGRGGNQPTINIPGLDGGFGNP